MRCRPVPRRSVVVQWVSGFSAPQQAQWALLDATHHPANHTWRFIASSEAVTYNASHMCGYPGALALLLRACVRCCWRPGPHGALGCCGGLGPGRRCGARWRHEVGTSSLHCRTAPRPGRRCECVPFARCPWEGTPRISSERACAAVAPVCVRALRAANSTGYLHPGYLHSALLPARDLQPGQRYLYRVGMEVRAWRGLSAALREPTLASRRLPNGSHLLRFLMPQSSCPVRKAAS